MHLHTNFLHTETIFTMYVYCNKIRSEIFMKNILYIDCANSGIAGDMFLAALYSICDDPKILDEIKRYVTENLSNVKIAHAVFRKIHRNGLFPFRLDIQFTETHPELHVEEIKEHIIKLSNHLQLSQTATEFASHWFSILLDAERAVHLSDSQTKIHIHELGSIDTLIDICGGTAYLDSLGVFSKDNIAVVCSEVAVGGGVVSIAHGTVPIPAPATLKIIEKYQIPIKGGPIEKELFTPTGAGLLGCLIDTRNLTFSKFIPSLKIQKVGYGTGTLGGEKFPNILRIVSGKSESVIDTMVNDVIVLETMVDDKSGESLGAVMNFLYEKGALDVNYIAVQGKKNRPGILLRTLTSLDNVDEILNVLFTQLGTLGVRYRVEKRFCLKREIFEKNTKIDNIPVTYHVKVAYKPSDPKEILFFKIEHDDIVKIAQVVNKPLSIIRTILESHWFSSQ